MIRTGKTRYRIKCSWFGMVQYVVLQHEIEKHDVNMFGDNTVHYEWIDSLPEWILEEVQDNVSLKEKEPSSKPHKPSYDR